METGLLIIFWYGILHAFGPDHLTAIADFSIGKDAKRTFLITAAFAIGHGIMLFMFAKLLSVMPIPQSITDYGDVISSLVIIGIGIYFLFMVFTDRIQIGRHEHHGQTHIHIWFGKQHSHDNGNGAAVSTLSIGALMGIGGVRGMLITLGMLNGSAITLSMVGVFIAGVSVVFMLFGVLMLIINQSLLTSKQNVRRVFATAGAISLVVGTNMILG
jgi:nickel/cobalt exporter